MRFLPALSCGWHRISQLRRLFSAGGTVGIPEMHLHNQVLFIYLVSYFNTPYKHPHPMLCTNPTCKPARLHEGLRPQPSTPVDAANIHMYFLGFLGLSQARSCHSCKAFRAFRLFPPGCVWFKLAINQILYSSGIQTNPCRVLPTICFSSPALSWNASGPSVTLMPPPLWKLEAFSLAALVYISLVTLFLPSLKPLQTTPSPLTPASSSPLWQHFQPAKPWKGW